MKRRSFGLICVTVCLFLVCALTNHASAQQNAQGSNPNKSTQNNAPDIFGSNGEWLTPKRAYGPWAIGAISTIAVVGLMLKRPGRSHLD